MDDFKHGIKLTPVSEPVNEETDFAVELDNENTAKEFIDRVLTLSSEHDSRLRHGCICIYKEFTDYSFQRPNCKYKDGKLVSKPLSDETLATTIRKVTARGGWGLMDFTLYLA